MLFFTAPPVEINGPSSLSLSSESDSQKDNIDDKTKNNKKTTQKEPLQLGHSIRYLAARMKRDAVIAEKRKRDAEEAARREPEAKRLKMEQEKQFEQELQGALRKAAGKLEDQLAAGTKLAMMELANGEGLQKEMNKELSLLENRWRVQGEKERMAAERRADRELRTEHKRVEILG